MRLCAQGWIVFYSMKLYWGIPWSLTLGLQNRKGFSGSMCDSHGHTSCPKDSPQYSLSVCIGPVARLSGVGAGMPIRQLTNQQLAVIVLLDDLPTLGNATCPEAEPKPIESCGVGLMFQVL